MELSSQEHLSALRQAALLMGLRGHSHDPRAAGRARTLLLPWKLIKEEPRSAEGGTWGTPAGAQSPGSTALTAGGRERGS